MTDSESWVLECRARSRRRETQIMVANAVIALLAAASLASWGAGWPVRPWAWIVIAAVLALEQIVAQRSIRLHREAYQAAIDAGREAVEHLHTLHEANGVLIEQLESLTRRLN